MIDIRATQAVYRKAKLILALGFCALVLLVAGIGIYTADIVGRLSSAEAARVAKRAHQTDLLKNARQDLARATTSVRDCLASNDEASIQRYREDAHQAWADASVAIADYAKSTTRHAELTARLRQELTDYLQSADTIIQLHHHRRDPKATDAFLSILLPLQERYSTTLAELLDFEWDELQSAAESSKAAATAAVSKVSLGGGGAVVLALVIAWLVFRFLGRLEDSAMTNHAEAAAAAVELGKLSERLFRSQEDERKRIAREIHDDFGQRMATALYELASISERGDATPELRGRIEGIRDDLSGLAKDIQNLSRGLHSAVLDKIGLEATIRSDCNLIRNRKTVQVDFEANNVPRGLPEDVALSIYRVYQEATQNALKHSGTDRLDVRLGVTNSALVLRVKDYGNGFDASSTNGSNSLGLVSMRERLRMVSGSLTVRTEPSVGTEVEASIPLPDSQPVGAPSKQERRSEWPLGKECSEQ
ncbi:MAG: MCP four helix bundle domain-containing protein [Bryobacterales bacterium]|nr:MCP four helix bundle domain-containing protein [Bryobacterales bacterium]